MKKIMMAMAALLALCGGAEAKGVITLTPEDYVQIYQLYSQYSLGIDSNNADMRTSTFTPDGTMSSATVSKHVPYGMAQMRKNMGAKKGNPIPVGGHVLTNIRLVPTADGVDATCYALLRGGTPDAKGNFITMPAFYTDKLVKTAAGWRFKSREVFEEFESVRSTP